MLSVWKTSGDGRKKRDSGTWIYSGGTVKNVGITYNILRLTGIVVISGDLTATKIEVETESKEDVIEALEAGADIIMLDNMSPSQATEMVKLINGRALTECSGNITLDTVRNYALSGVDFISSGELTHSVKAFDISLKNFMQL